MLEEIQKEVAQLTISDPPDTTKKTKKKTKKTTKKARRTQPEYTYPEKWVYGFQLKNRFVLDMAKKYRLPWKTDSFYAAMRVEHHVGYMSGVDYRVCGARYRGRTATILFFVEDNGRKRLDDLEVSKEDMEKLRKAMGLPEGTQPKWYEVHGQYPEGTEYDSEDDTDWEDVPIPEDVNTRLAKRVVFIDLDYW